MAGGKGGSTTTSVQVPEYIEEAAKRNLSRADVISQIGYVPYYGPDVAAFTPTQEAAFQNVAGQAGAFGLTTPAGGAMAGMPTPQEFAGGVRGYSSAPLYEQSLGEFARRRPAQFNLIESLFINPVTGEFEGAPVVDATPPVAGGGTGGGGNGGGGGGGGGLGGGGGAGGGGGGGVIIPEIPYVPDIPLVEDEVNIVPVGDATAGDIIAQTDIDALSDAMTGIGLGGIPDTAGQKYQYYNPDIDYTDAFQSELTGQYVGTLDPSAEGIAAVQAAQDQLGIGQVSDDFYTEQPIYSASDFPLGTSTQGFDYSVYAGDDDRQASDLMQNYYGSTVSTGYDVGQVDPALAAAAGYTQSASGPSQAQIDQEAAMGLDPFGGAGPVVGAEDTFGADLYRSLTDPTYDPEGTVLSRALDGLLSPSSASSQPPKLETLGDFVQAAPSMGMTATEAGIAYEQSKGVDDRPYDPFYDTKVKDPISGKTLTPFQLNNRINSPNLGGAYAEAGITSLDQALAVSPQVGASVSTDLPAPPAKGTKIKDPISGKTLTASQIENRIKSPNLGKAYAEAGITNLNELLALAAST